MSCGTVCCLTILLSANWCRSFWRLRQTEVCVAYLCAFHSQFCEGVEGAERRTERDTLITPSTPPLPCNQDPTDTLAGPDGVSLSTMGGVWLARTGKDRAHTLFWCTVPLSQLPPSLSLSLSFSPPSLCQTEIRVSGTFRFCCRAGRDEVEG
jgi:hypothetical protein